MTREEFNETRFTAETKIKYDDGIYLVASINFKEGLFGLDIYNDPDDLWWIRCESGELVR